MGVASLVLGIIALVSAVVGGFLALGWVGSVCGVVAIVLGALARKKASTRGAGTGGLVCGIIALAWGTITYIACYAYASSVSSSIESALGL